MAMTTRKGGEGEFLGSDLDRETVENAGYISIPIGKIQVVARSKGGKSDRLFQNPRSEAQFTSERLAPLRYSIQVDELQQPLTVRVITDDGTRTGKPIRYELIAGERRYRSCLQIRAEKLPCFSYDQPKPERFGKGDVVVCKGRFGKVVSHQGDRVVIGYDDQGRGKETLIHPYGDVWPTISGDQKYAVLPIKPHYNIDDDKALALAWAENNESEPLTIAEEMALMERLHARGLKLAQIANLLRLNITMVSQTLAFRKELPPEALKLLLDGVMVRNVAVGFLSYPEADRPAMLERMRQIEESTRKQKIAEHEIDREAYEDEAEIHRTESEKAAAQGDDDKATKSARRAAVSEAKARQKAEQVAAIRSKAGHLTEGHQKLAAADLGVNPKRQKALSEVFIRQRYMDGIADYESGKKQFDPILGEEIPPELVAMVRRTASAILHGVQDPLSIIRDYMVQAGKWKPLETEEVEV